MSGVPSDPSLTKTVNYLSDILKKGNNYGKILEKNLTNLTKVTNLTKKKVTQIDRLSREFNRVSRKVKLAEKIAKKANKVTDLLKKGKFKQVNPNLGNAVGFALNLASIGLSLLTINHVGNLQEIQLRKEGIVEKDLNIAFQNFVKNALTIRKIREEFNTFVSQYKQDKDKLGANITANLQNLVKVRELSEAAKKQANDALYEVREGRKKVEAKIDENFNTLRDGLQQLFNDVISQNAELATLTAEARKLGNDALYEARTNNQQLKAEINQKFQAARKLGNDALYEARANRQKLEANFGQQLNSLRRNLNLEVQNIERKSAAQVDSLFNSSKGLINKALTEARTAQANAKSAQVDASRLRQQVNQNKADISRLNVKSPELNIEPTVKRLIANSPQVQGLIAGLKAAGVKVDGIERYLLPALDTAVKAVGYKAQLIDGRVTKLEQDVKVKDPGITRVEGQLNNLRQRIGTTETSIGTNKIEIDKLKAKGNKMDSKQYNELLGKLGLIPLLIAKVPGQTAARMPQPLTGSQIEAATGKAMCRSTAPGGCMNKGLSNTADAINRNTNQWGNNLLNKINAGANAAQLALLKVIDSKLGKQIAGGISGQVVKNFERVNKFAEWLKIDRMLNMLTWVNTTHNAMMLSTNLGSTLFSIVDNIAGLFFKDIDGVDIDTGKTVSTFFDDAAKKIFGVKNWEDTKVKFNRYNRIYQSVQNALNNITSMFNSMYGALDVVGNRVSRIGNAMRWFGVLSDKAFGWMNENNIFSNPIITRITKVTEAADALEQVSSDVVSISDNGKELIKNTKEIKKGLDDLSKEETKKEDKERSSLKIPDVKDTDVA